MTIGLSQKHWDPAPVLPRQLAALEVRLARTSAEIEAAMRLRHMVFREERSAGPEHGTNLLDRDHYDAACDHLVVTDPFKGDRIVGTYRLLRQERTGQTGGFYSASMFDIEPLISRHPEKRFLELGRSCVAPEYRGKQTLDLLWKGVWAYSRWHRTDVMIGSVSLPGADANAHSQALSFLHHNCLADGPWRIGALEKRRADPPILPPEKVDNRRAFAGLPPLIKSYLRAGAKLAHGCVADADLDTTVVFMVMPVDTIEGRYLRHYGNRAGNAENGGILPPS